ncbi:ABC transporter ATP-binding protein [hydrothermal vent metagenome]|uniref:ABC transporter ATP-binding protein n=1 Tax=hydrothermal vent metagenome TaxID=652676 RepID=A0A1W1DYC4_9ZZZZ
MTVLTGENGTGKSFFTKTLYSAFNTLNTNVLHRDITMNITLIELRLSILKLSIQRFGKDDKQQMYNLSQSLLRLKDDLNKFKDESATIYFLNTIALYEQTDKFLIEFESYLKKIEKKPIKIKLAKRTIKELKYVFNLLREKLKDSQSSHITALNNALRDEIRDNFQITDLSELISFGEKECKIQSQEKDFTLTFRSNSIVSSVSDNFIAQINQLSRVVFFESPAYWSVRDALNKSKEVEQKNDLTGVSKYFYDLDRILNIKSKNPPIEAVAELATELKTEIGGEFIFDNGRLSFEDVDGNAIDKNLISFGMTNLGMIQALLKNNVVSKGSFVFFDEPETNLHPAWQVLLTKVLIKLAENGVNVVMATHSLDMIKALEVHTKDKDGDFIAVNHFTKAGGLFEFDSSDITENLIESREELSSPYKDLYIEDAKNG